MNKFLKKFAEVKKEQRLAFMPFVVAGFPTYKKSLELAVKLADQSDFLEIGFPFSDPVADGTVIQKANVVALKNGMTTKKAFAFVKSIKDKSNIPVTVLVYSNVVYQQGLDSFYSQAKKSGVDGVLLPDVPCEEITSFLEAGVQNKVNSIFTVSQTTSNERLDKITKMSDSYLYLISVLGITGVRNNFASGTTALIKRVKKRTHLPLAVGFGISNRRQVVALKKAGVSGVIVGSALVKIIADENNMLKVSKKLLEYKNELMREA